LQSVVFIDDNPVERAWSAKRCRRSWFQNGRRTSPHPSALERLRCFDSPALSREDTERTRLYAEERKRDQLQKQVGSMATG
jgi:predicted enzyme involved in methoxymalonyl-ACP biosynthesis